MSLDTLKYVSGEHHAWPALRPADPRSAPQKLISSLIDDVLIEANK